MRRAYREPGLRVLPLLPPRFLIVVDTFRLRRRRVYGIDGDTQ